MEGRHAGQDGPGNAWAGGQVQRHFPTCNLGDLFGPVISYFETHSSSNLELRPSILGCGLALRFVFGLVVLKCYSAREIEATVHNRLERRRQRSVSLSCCVVDHARLRKQLQLVLIPASCRPTTHNVQTMCRI